MWIHRLTATGFSVFVLLPIRIGHRALGESVWPPLEVVAGALGAVGGAVARPLIRAMARKKNPIEVVLYFTDMLEGALGIEGTNEVLDRRTGRRRIHHCPFAESLRGTTGFCTRLGELAGKTSCASLIPGSDFEITATLSQKHPWCEYIYRLREDGERADRRA